MRRTLGLALAAFTAVAAVPALGADPELPFRVQRLSERIVIFTELSPWESNHVVIVGEQGLVLVDPGHTPLMGRLIRQALKQELGRDRVDWVVDTHEHWGHTWGNAAFPEAVVIGHERVARVMAADAANREARAGVFRGQAEQAAARLKGLDPASEEGRAARLQLDHCERIVHGLSEPGFTVRVPELTFSDQLGLDLGDVSLEMSFLGRGHSDSDIVVLIPEDKTVLLGCFFLEQGPLPVFGNQPKLDPERWLEVLGAVLDREPEVEHVVLGQHAVWPRERLAAMRDYVAGLWPALQRLDAENVDLESAVARLPVPAELGFLRQAGVSEEDLEGFHRLEVTTLWRQLQESAAAAVEQAIAEGGVAAGVARYRELAARDDSQVFFDENEFNLLGYKLLGQGRVDQAIAVLELNVERFPGSWNVYDSLGEACAVRGERERAIALYRRSLELNPDNSNGVQALERLGAAE